MTTGAATARYKFIGHALRGDGGFRPSVGETLADSGKPVASVSGASYIDRYPRESDDKFGRRNAVAFYDSPLAQACSRFIGYLATKPAARKLGHDLYTRMAEDIDGKGNSIEVYWQLFLTEAKARGACLLLVDMPSQLAPSLAAQIAQRKAPYWTTILPEDLTEWQLGEDGRFTFAVFSGQFTHADGRQEDCEWYFDASKWEARKGPGGGKTVLAEGAHPCGECPVLIWAEAGEFPCFGPFASIADLSKRLFNLESELDEILRSQTFSLLTMQVPDGADETQKIAAAQTAGQTIGTQNLVVHSGSTPAFIAPDSGPAETYMKRIEALRARIDVIGLNVAAIDQQESGIAMQMRFQQINAELVRCAVRTEDLERRAWDLSAKWLKMSATPEVEWSRDYQIADVAVELQILQDMQASAMPTAVIAEQQRRIVRIQFGGDENIDDLIKAVDEKGLEPPTDGAGNVVPIDRNAPAREALMRMANGQ